MAGGKGTRLRPYTTTLPKPLVPVGERPILEIILNQLRKAGVKKVILAVNHQADLLMAFFGNGEKHGLEIVYSLEEESLSTVGPLKLIDDLPEHFLVMGGDLLTDLDYNDLFRAHLRSNAPLTVSTYKRVTRIDFGVFEIDSACERAVGFREKPVYRFDVSMGVYVFSRSLLDRVPADRSFGFDQLVLEMLEDNEPIQVYPFNGYWLDIGRPDDYDQANLDIETLEFTR